MYRLNTHQILVQQHAQTPTFRKMVQRGHPITATQIPSISTITLCNNQKPELDGNGLHSVAQTSLSIYTRS